MSFEVTITVGGIKEEHAQYNAVLATALAGAFGLDGEDLRVDISVEENRDGVERWHELVEIDDVDRMKALIPLGGALKWQEKDA